MEDGEVKDESMPAPVSVMAKPEDISDIEKAGSGTKIDNEIERLVSISKDYAEEFSTLCNQFKESNKVFFGDLDIFKENLLKLYSEKANPNEKLSLKNKKLDDDQNFRSITEKPIQLINKISTLYSTLFEMVKSNMKILSQFLNIGKKLEGGKPLEDFFSEEFSDIVNSWLFLKIDFDNFNVNEALAKSEFDEHFKAFLTKTNKKKSMKIYFEHLKGEVENEETKKKYAAEKKFLKDNIATVTKITLKNTGDFGNFIERKFEFQKLKKFIFENGRLYEDFDIKNKMPNLEKLSIKYCPSLQIFFMEKIPVKIKELYLENCNIINEEFKSLAEKIFVDKNPILNTLEILSLAGNNLTKVDFSRLKAKQIYQSLKEMNFKKNKLYKFIYNPENFPQLKFINCSKNNFNKSFLKPYKIMSLESGNGFLFEPDLCKSYYDDLKKKICTKDELPYIFDYLNISFMPKNLSLKYFSDFELNPQLMQKIKKLDLSYNTLNCNTFFKYLEKNNNFIHLHSLNLNGNEIDDTFFEKLIKNNYFPKLQHLYLNSNLIGDTKVKIGYKDDVQIYPDNQSEKDKSLVYKLRLMYKFIEQMPHLNKLTITKNPIAEFYSVTKGTDMDKSDKFIKRDLNGKIVVNCLFSMLIKIRDELLTSDYDKEKRKGFNLKFDCRSNVNKNSDNYPYSERPIEKKKN